jgi:serine/threonine protein phosphatase 1
MLKQVRIGSCNHIQQLDLREFKGRVFFATDTHGYYDLLMEGLSDLAFNSKTDILLSAGDWTDRGPDSKHVLDFLESDWIFSARGNHEQMFIDAEMSGWFQQNRSVRCLLANGGTWALSLDKAKSKAICEMFKSMPLGIELLLPHGRKAGIVHAEVPYKDWDKFVNIDPMELEWNGQAVAQWSRTWYDYQLKEQVAGVDFVLAGHTPTDSGDVEQLGNMVFADAGSFFRDKLNVFEINSEFMRGVSNGRGIN